MPIDFRPTSKTESTKTPLLTGENNDKNEFWSRTARAVKNAPGVISRGFRWLSSLPGKIYHQLTTRKKISERSVKKTLKKPRQSKKRAFKKLSEFSLSKIINIFRIRKSPTAHHEGNKKHHSYYDPKDDASPTQKDQTPFKSTNISDYRVDVRRTIEDEPDLYDAQDLEPLIDEDDEWEKEQQSYVDPFLEIYHRNHDTHPFHFKNSANSQRPSKTNQDRLFRNIIPDTELKKLTSMLVNRRAKVQKLIIDTQLSFLRYGPSPSSTLAQLDRIEKSTLGYTRALFKHYDYTLMPQELQEITKSLDDDFQGLRVFIEHANKYDFRSSHQYLQQIEVYERLVSRLVEQEPYQRQIDKYRYKAKKIIHEKKEKVEQEQYLKEKKESSSETIDTLNDNKDQSSDLFDFPLPSDEPVLETDKKKSDPPVESIAENMDDFLELDLALRKLFHNPKLFDRELINVLSENSEPFETRLNVYLDGKWREVSSSYFPAAAMRLCKPTEQLKEKSGNRSPFENDYEGKLAPSMQRDTKHAVNMMGYTMKIDGNPVTRQIRVGCPYAYAEKDKTEREKVTLDRIKEIFTALLVQNHLPELQKAMDDPKHEPIDLDAVYMNLLSPDYIRNNRLMTAIGQDDEKKWVEELHEMFKKLSGQKMELKVYLDNGQDATVKITPNVRMFVIPCNQLALKQPAHSSFFKKALNYLMRKAGNTWKTVSKVNNESKSWLDGLVSRKLRNLPEGRQKKVKALNDQLWKLLGNKKDFEAITNEFDPFIFTDRLFQILEELNIDIFSGCKSNKDRTSIVQAVLQSLLTTNMHLHESQENENQEANPLYAMIVELFMVYGGHTEVQKRNTALVGFRLDETPVRDMDRISTELMRRNPRRADREQRTIFSDPELLTPITLEVH